MSTTIIGAWAIGTITGIALIGTPAGAGIPGTAPDGDGDGITAGAGIPGTADGEAIRITAAITAETTTVTPTITQEAHEAMFLPADAIMRDANILRCQAEDEIQRTQPTAREPLVTKALEERVPLPIITTGHARTMA